MKLRVVKDYACRQHVYFDGSIIEVDEVFGEWLRRDAPDCFEIVKEVAEKAPDKPPKDKMLSKPKGSK